MNTVFARNIAIENRHVASIKGQARRHSLLSLTMMLFGCGVIAGCGSKPSTVATVAQREVRNPTVEAEASRGPIEGAEVRKPTVETEASRDPIKPDPIKPSPAVAPSSDEIKTTQISADQLHGAYEANEIAAGEKYGDKWVEVVGIVKEVGKTFGVPYVSLVSSSDDFIAQVRCDFPKGSESKLAKIAKGQKVVIKGKCKGYLFWV